MKSKSLALFLGLLILITGCIFMKDNAADFAWLKLNTANGNKFIYGAIQSFSDRFESSPYIHYDKLGLNCVHSYCGEDSILTSEGIYRHVPKGYTSSNDRLSLPVKEYADSLLITMREAAAHNQSSIIWSRPVIEYLAYGQSSIYEAENIKNTEPLWFYSFQNNSGRSEEENSAKVLHCSRSILGQGSKIVLSRLRANTEQCRFSYDGENKINQWVADNECYWYIKPKIRIDPKVALEHPETDVCRVYVINQDKTSKIQPVTIKAGSFLNSASQYSGEYLEEFNLDYPQKSSMQGIKFKGSLGNYWSYTARCNFPESKENDYPNHADIQIEWLDNCEMWIDYVKVENDIADELFKHKWDAKIDSECVLANTEAANVLKFYVEYTEFNNLPCIKYINQRLRANTLNLNHVDIVTDFNENIFYHVNHLEKVRLTSPEWLAKNYVLRGGLSCLYTESYPLNSMYYDPPQQNEYSRIPNTLADTKGKYVLALAVTPDEYEAWLQQDLDSLPYKTNIPRGIEPPMRSAGCAERDILPDAGGFRWVMETSDRISQIADIPFIHMPQAHLWFYPWEVHREPTNEELDVFANLAVSYGARGLNYFWFLGFDETNGGCTKFSLGMMNKNELRTTNVYGEQKEKWKVFEEIGHRMKAWEPSIMSFDNAGRITCIFRDPDSRREFVASTYFDDIKTFPPGKTNLQAPDAAADDNAHTYLQASVFKKTGDEIDQYFMLVNRRCSPVTSASHDGMRYIKIRLKPNSPKFAFGSKWKIVNIADEKESYFFERLSKSYIELGWFNPGEGKLYRIEPAF